MRWEEKYRAKKESKKEDRKSKNKEKKKKRKGEEERKKKKKKEKGRKKKKRKEKKKRMGVLKEWKSAAKWRGKEVARRHREMAEGVWGKYDNPTGVRAGRVGCGLNGFCGIRMLRVR